MTKKVLWLSSFIFLGGILFFYGMPFAQMGMMGGGGMSGNRHHTRVPSQYRAENPLPASQKNLEEGARLYQNNCAVCHGKEGLGDGEAGKALNPRPANLAWMMKMPMTSESYLYWTIAEGGTSFNTAMPAFKEALEEDQIWKLILHLQEI